MLESAIENSVRSGTTHDPAPFHRTPGRQRLERFPGREAGARMRADLTLPEKMVPYGRGRDPFGRGDGRVVNAPGHADHQIMLYDEERKILFAADHVLLKITPNVGSWPESEPKPPCSLPEEHKKHAQPTGGPVSQGTAPFPRPERTDRRATPAHEERLELRRREIAGTPKTPFEVSRKVFRYGLSLYERCFALAKPRSPGASGIREAGGEGRGRVGLFSGRCSLSDSGTPPSLPPWWVERK